MEKRPLKKELRGRDGNPTNERGTWVLHFCHGTMLRGLPFRLKKGNARGIVGLSFLGGFLNGVYCNREHDPKKDPLKEEGTHGTQDRNLYCFPFPVFHSFLILLLARQVQEGCPPRVLAGMLLPFCHGSCKP